MMAQIEGDPCKKCGTTTKYVKKSGLYCRRCYSEKRREQYKKKGGYQGYAKKYRDKNKNKLNAKERDDYRISNKKYIYHMVKRAEKRASKKELPFNITIKDIVIPEYCPILGIKLIIGEDNRKGPSNASPSLDRIVPEKGYVPGNIRVISMKANKIKSDAQIEDIEKVLLFMKSALN